MNFNSKPFTSIFNPSITQGIVPNDCMKVSRKTTVFKSDDATDHTNYRHIAVLSPLTIRRTRVVATHP